MRYRYAKKLTNRDEVEVHIYQEEWDRGYVVGDPKEVEVEGQKVIELTVQTSNNGLLFNVTHTMIR